jgi:hypothetical protein
MSTNETVVVLFDWHEPKRLHRLSDAQVQMARDLKLNRKHLLRLGNPDEPPLALRVATLYLERFQKALPNIGTAAAGPAQNLRTRTNRGA